MASSIAILLSWQWKFKVVNQNKCRAESRVLNTINLQSQGDSDSEDISLTWNEYSNDLILNYEVVNSTHKKPEKAQVQMNSKEVRANS